MTVYWFIVIIAVVALGWYGLRRFESMSRHSDGDLRAYFSSSGNELFWRNALKELRRRGEDVSFARNAVLNLMSSDTLKDRVVGWACLREAFPEDAATLSYDQKQPSPQVLRQLEDLKGGLRPRSGGRADG